MLFLTYDDSGKTTGAYMQDVVPADHWIEVSLDQYDNWFNLHLVNGVLVPIPTPQPVPYVPQVISPRQFRQSLTHYGYRSNVESAVSGSDQDTKDWYEFATQFERQHPKVLSMATSLGYTSDQLDAVWTYGASI